MNFSITLEGDIDKFISGATGAAAQIEAMEERIVRQAGRAGLKNVATNIINHSGKLAQSYAVGGADNIFEVRCSAGSASVRYGSNCPYAVAHEKGYNQRNRVNKKSGKKPSLWVPGNWNGGKFSYNGEKGVKTGMMLSGRFVPGGHEFEKSIPDTQENYKEICKREVESLFKALF